MNKVFFIISFIITLSIVFVSCGQTKVTKSGSSYIKECSFQTGQENTFLGKWSSPPVKVSFAAGQFSGGEVGGVSAGVATWNDFYSAIRGFTMFQINTKESTVNQTTANCLGGTLADGVVVYKRTGGWTKGASAVAITTHCKTVGSGGATFFNAIIEFNYVNFFNSAKNPDMQSIAVHELGHLLGLDHSCGQVDAGKSVVACPGDQNDDLAVAVMNPTAYFDTGGNGEVKRDLKTNDQQRASCLY